MKPIKITIKTEGLSVRTKDLSIGLSILNYIANHGIMGYSMVPNSLLNRTNKVLGHMITTLSQAVKRKEVDASATEEEVPSRISRLRIDLPSHDTSRKDEAWVDIKKEDAPKFTKKSKISGATIPAPERNENIDKIVNKSSKRQRQWTKEEILILKNNFDISDKALYSLIPTRTLEAIRFKRRGLLKEAGKPTKRKKSKSSIWTETELETLRLNIHMKPKQLQTLPWLKRKTRSQISQKKYELTTRIKLEEGREEYEPANKIKLEERRREQDES